MGRAALAAAGLGSLALGWARPAAAATDCRMEQIAELPVTMRGRAPTITVAINEQDERFLLDSGAFFSIITPGKARELQLPLQALPPGFTMTGVGGEVHPSLTYVKTVGLAGAKLNHIPFIVGGSEVGRGAGVIGQNVLGIGDVEYDLAHGAVRLFRIRSCGNAIPTYWAGPKAISIVTLEPRTEYQRHTIGAVTINGIKMRAIFDTGADSTVISTAAAAKLGFKPGNKDMVYGGTTGGIGRRTVASYSIPVTSIAIGDGEEVRNTHLDVTDLGLNTDMLIGADFFLSHRVFVSNARGKLFFTYEGGAIFGDHAATHIDQQGKPVAQAASGVADPTDADGFARRGAAAMSRRDYPAALADLDRAVAMAPGVARYRLQRAQAHFAAREPDAGRADIDAAVRLDPDDAEARVARAGLRVARGDRAGAAADADAVAGHAAPAADVRLTLGSLYNDLDRWGDAVAQYDLWLRYHPDDRRRPTALNGRCWARGLMGTDLARALADCDAAIRARPNNAAFLDSRALVRLRGGDAAGAVRDYDAAIAIRPDQAWSLYARGLAKQRLGDRAGAQADMAAGTRIDAGVAARARTIGLIPGAGPAPATPSGAPG